MKRKLLFAVLSILLVQGCTSPKVLQSNFQAAEYNSLSNQYSDMLTVVNEYKESNVICVRNEKFGKGWTRICFDKNKIDEHLAAINKYIRWYKLAKERNDQITKDIATVKQDSVYWVNNLDYSIYSGTILSITDDDINPVYPSVIYFNYTQAIKFSDFLIDYKNGTNKRIDTSVYN